MDCLPPASIAEATVAAGQKKSSLSVVQLIILGMLAGAYIGFGAQLYSLVTSDLSPFVGFGLTRLVGGLCFSMGLVFVILGGAELFTGNSLIAVAALSGHISWRRPARNWAWVYAANLAGSLVLALVLFGAKQYSMNGDLVGVSALRIAVAKVNMPFWTAFFRGLLCNWLVCLAVWMATGATDMASKIIAIVLPITAFVASGFEHSVANMFFIPMGLMIKNVPSVVAAAGSLPGIEHLTWGGGLIVRNLLPVTAGNLAGGIVFVACAYWIAYLLPSKGKGR